MGDRNLIEMRALKSDCNNVKHMGLDSDLFV